MLDQCPAGTICVKLPSLSSGACMPTCTGDHDCRQGLTCEALNYGAPAGSVWLMAIDYICWHNGFPGQVLGGSCGKDADCISGMCFPLGQSPGGFCTVFCDTNSAQSCKREFHCAPMAGEDGFSIDVCVPPQP